MKELTEIEVKIKTTDNIALNYETEWACAFDFKASEDVEIAPWQAGMIETGTVIEVPKGCMLMLAPRSSTYKKLGSWWLILVNSVWIIDNDYCWDTDSVKFVYLNTGKETCFIKKWDRIWQGVFVQIKKANFKYVEKMNNKDRGGFGTTWLK